MEDLGMLRQRRPKEHDCVSEGLAWQGDHPEKAGAKNFRQLEPRRTRYFLHKEPWPP